MQLDIGKGTGRLSSQKPFGDSLSLICMRVYGQENKNYKSGTIIASSSSTKCLDFDWTRLEVKIFGGRRTENFSGGIHK